MNKMYQRALFIFRRDLRLADNTGLIFALKNAEKVLPIFIFTPEQVGRNPFKSNHCLQFMIESLQDLEEQLHQKGGKLYRFRGSVKTVAGRLIAKHKIDALIVNRDYTPYSHKRDEDLKAVCDKQKIAFHSFDDLLLHPPEKTVKKDGKPYLVFTPFFNANRKKKVAKPVRNPYTNYLAISHSLAPYPTFPKVTNPFLGGRKASLALLKHPKPEKMHLSAYLKFTVCSPREVYAACRGRSHLIRSLYWRDFFTTIAYYFPHVFEGPFYPKYKKLHWSKSKAVFQKWCQGKTGFPIVDAAMRQLNQTGFIDNRFRMIAASFLIKDLYIDWRWGEKYFAQHLIDYDPAVNNGNWQWVASTGADAQPYFRVFNPWMQQKKFDPKCSYIKEWVEELKSASPSTIHAWYEAENHTSYPSPILDHSASAEKTIQQYRKAT